MRHLELLIMSTAESDRLRVVQRVAEQGYCSPRRVAVTGFNGTSIDQTIRMRLTTLDAPRREIGREAALSVMDLLDGKTGSTGQRLALRFCSGNDNLMT